MNNTSAGQEFIDADSAAPTISAGLRRDPWYQAQEILSHRDHSAHELRVKLQRRGFKAADIDEVMNKLTRLHLIDDEKFAALVVAETLRFKPVGPRWLINKLQQKGIAHEFIEPAVYDVIDDAKEIELARAAADSWRRSHPRHATDQQRVIRFLVSRGFSYEAAATVI